MTELLVCVLLAIALLSPVNVVVFITSYPLAISVAMGLLFVVAALHTYRISRAVHLGHRENTYSERW